MTHTRLLASSRLLWEMWAEIKVYTNQQIDAGESGNLISNIRRFFARLSIQRKGEWNSTWKWLSNQQLDFSHGFLMSIQHSWSRVGAVSWRLG
jgi:hypothetical protein